MASPNTSCSVWAYIHKARGIEKITWKPKEAQFDKIIADEGKKGWRGLSRHRGSQTIILNVVMKVGINRKEEEIRNPTVIIVQRNITHFC